MPAVGIALVVIALLNPISVPTLVVWLIGIGTLGFWMGRSAAGSDEGKEVRE